MTASPTDASWNWPLLAQRAPAPLLRRALDLLSLGQVDVHPGRGPHVSGRAGRFDVAASLATGEGQCACGRGPACAHVVALVAAASGLSAVLAPPGVRASARAAFDAREPQTPVAAFPETATDMEVPADAVSDAQRRAIEATRGVVRKSTTAYSVPRRELDALAASLEALGTSLVAFQRSPFVRFRATLRGSTAGERAQLVALETPGMAVRNALDRRGFRPVRRPKSLTHEYEGPASELHLLAEELGLLGTAVVLAEAMPPAFETMRAPGEAEPPAEAAPAKPRGASFPVVFSRHRFEWWTPRESVTPLAAAILQRHGVVAAREIRMGTDGLRAAERELTAAGIHVARVDEAMPVTATLMLAPDTDATARVQFVAPPTKATQDVLASLAFTQAPSDATSADGPIGHAPALVAALASVGVHVVPAEGGWPNVPLAPTPAMPAFVDDPRLPIAREGLLVHDARGDRVFVRNVPDGTGLPRALRIALYRAGWIDDAGRATAPATDAGRLVAALRESGIDVKWPKPTSSDWRLASVRYNDRSRREGGGTIVHLKGPLPLGRLGGVDPGAEAQRIAAIVHAMEDALKRHHPDARPLAHGAMPGVWTVNGGAGKFLLDAAAKGASVSTAPALNPIPLGRGVVLVDTSSLPPRIMEFRRATMDDDPSRPIVSPEIENVIRRVVPAGLEIDAERGHYLVPSTRIAPLLAALRELGAKVLQRRLAPRGQRYARWEPKLPEDETGARPTIREPFRGRYDGNVPGLRETTRLDAHQKEALAFILHHEHSCLLADEMGLGKTLTAIASAQFLPGRVLVVCPASARAVWKQEVTGWTTERARVLLPSDKPDDVLASDGGEKYVVVAYSGLAKFADELRKIPFDLVVLDESHYVKSRAAQRTRLVEEKLRSIPRRLILSGTPVMNEPSEIRTQLAFVHPDEWSDTAWFNRRFQRPWKYGTPDVRDAVLQRLRDYLEGIMLRREKRQALPDLPEKRLHVHRLPLPDEARHAYDEQEDNFRDYLHEHEETALTREMSRTAGRLEALKQTILVGKLPLILDRVRAMLDNGEKVVIFCHYREPIRALAKELHDHGVVTLTGSTKAEERGEVVRRFQDDESIRVFVGQTVAAGVAVTLTAARHAVFTDLEWNPALHRQAMDRVHRKTQTRDVEVHFFLAEDTIEEDIAEVLEEKTEMMDMLLEGRKGSAFGLREKEATQREVALRILSRRRRLRATADGEDD